MCTLYDDTLEATFLSRPNRFVALVLAEGREIVCHIKNTGRLMELLVPGAKVILAKAKHAARKTAYDMVAVYKGDMLVNIDSQAPNEAAFLFLKHYYPDAVVRREQRWQDSRLDFHVQGSGLSLYVEVKGCTLEKDGIALFPDAPTMRGIKHLHALTSCVQRGHRAMVLFVVQMSPVKGFAPYDAMHPAFGEALRAAALAGVEVLAYECMIMERGMRIHQPVPVML